MLVLKERTRARLLDIGYMICENKSTLSLKLLVFREAVHTKYQQIIIIIGQIIH